MKTGVVECWSDGVMGIRTRRRPIGRDYAAAKDAECGKLEKACQDTGCGSFDFGFGIGDFGLNRLNG